MGADVNTLDAISLCPAFQSLYVTLTAKANVLRLTSQVVLWVACLVWDTHQIVYEVVDRSSAVLIPWTL